MSLYLLNAGCEGLGENARVSVKTFWGIIRASKFAHNGGGGGGRLPTAVTAGFLLLAPSP